MKEASGVLQDFAKDLRFGLRGLLRAPSFTLIAVLSLAVGIGVNVGLYSSVEAIWGDAIPGVENTEQIVEVLDVSRGQEFQEWAYPDFADCREAANDLLQLAGWKRSSGNLSTEAGGQNVRLMYVSANYFRVLGVQLTQGRDFLSEEDTGPGQHAVAIVSHDMWQHRLGATRNIVGQAITLNRTPYTVVGVAPPSFSGHRRFAGVDLWIPMMQAPYVAGPSSLAEDREALWVHVLGRMRTDVSLGQVNSALQTLFERLANEHPQSNEGRSARAYPFQAIPALNRTDFVLATAAMVGLVGAVFLIICGNIAGMVLARTSKRGQEIAIRIALGSGRDRLIRLFLVEALLLASAGGSAGALLAFWATSALDAAGLTGIPSPSSMGPDLAILGYALLFTLATTLAVGLLPALRFSKPDLALTLKGESAGGSRRVGRVHRLAATAQTGVALVLVVVCGLCVRALQQMDERDPGFDPQNLFVTRLDLSQEGRNQGEEATVFLDRLLQAAAALPGTGMVSTGDGYPLDLVGNYTHVSRSEAPDSEHSNVTVEFTRAGEGYFRTVGTPLLRGRGFRASDDERSELVSVVTKSLADLLWPGEEPLGRRLSFPLTRSRTQIYTVVGVVNNVASSRPTEDHPHVFVPLRQQQTPRVILLVRGPAATETFAASLRSAILSVDSGLSDPQVTLAESTVIQSTADQRGIAGGAAGFGTLAIALSAIGVYGVVAFAVSTRTREIGLRMALGATRGLILRTILWDAIRLSLPGLLGGALVSFAIAAAMGSMLLGLSPLDPVSFASGAGILLLVVLLASLLPAHRASSIDPIKALHYG